MSVLGRRTEKLIYFIFVSGWAIVFAGWLNVSAILKSTNYQFIETSLGGTGLTETSSPNFQSQQSGGIIGVGTSSDGTVQIQAGHETTSDPALSFAVLSNSASFGSFSPTSTAVANSSFEVSDYTSYGYIVQIFGTPPTNSSGYSISPMTTTAASSVGTEQYGLNLVANTNPVSFGANPNNGQFGYGSVSANYDTPNNYRFVNGDTIASSAKSTGLTIYTMSFIVNVSDITPGGQYIAKQNIICTGTY